MSCLLTETPGPSHTRPVSTCLNVCLTKWAYSVQICSLAQRFPELKSLGSCDLSPASCISVAWYGGCTGSLLYMLGLFSVGMVAQNSENDLMMMAACTRLFRYLIYIYQISTGGGPTLRDLDACFLTYQFMSTQFPGVSNSPQTDDS